MFDLLVNRQVEPKFRTLWRGRESCAEKNRTLCRQRGGFDIFNASSSPCDTGFDFFGSRIGGFRISGGHCGWAKNLKISVVEKNRFPRQTLKPKFSIFRRRRPDALLTDRGHGGFAFFAHRHCPATQGSTFSARSARRVREKSTRSWPQISNRAKGSNFFAHRPCPATQGSIFLARSARRLLHPKADLEAP